MNKKNIGCIGWIVIILLMPIILGFAIMAGIIYGMYILYKKGKFDKVTEKTNTFIANCYNKLFKKELSKPILSPKGFTILATILIFLVLMAFGSDEKVIVDTKVSNNTTKVEQKVDTSEEVVDSNTEKTDSKNDSTKDIFEGYKIIEVDGGDLSGHREANVAVDIGFGDREYWAFTNEYGQLVKVVAKEIILQDDSTEPVTSSGRYYSDEAKVPGVESKDLDEGHIIADSLGGVSNAYNITPQNSTLNRHGDQAYMEKVIRDAGGCTDFTAIITYPDTTTQIPSHYSYTYTINGNKVTDEFDNINPDEYNSNLDSDISVDNSSDESQSNSSEIVYWTPNGKSYHSSKSCSTLSRSKTILSGTIEESGKFDPCDKCN